MSQPTPLELAHDLCAQLSTRAETAEAALADMTVRRDAWKKMYLVLNMWAMPSPALDGPGKYDIKHAHDRLLALGEIE